MAQIRTPCRSSGPPATWPLGGLLLAMLAAAACSKDTGGLPADGGSDGRRAQDARGAADLLGGDALVPARDFRGTDQGSGVLGARCARAGGVCDCSCGGETWLQGPAALNDCPQPCATCGACSLLCCLPCDVAAGCVKSCDGGSCVCECPPTKTSCGADGASCDRATQVCVGSGPYGPTEQHSCEALPAGCAADRTCACLAASLCGAGDSCSERADNVIFCDNGSQ